MDASGPTDSYLLGEWHRCGCERSFRQLVERYSALVHHAAKTSGGDDALTADVAQATFILLARKADALLDRSTLAGWLHLTASHHARNAIRSRARESRKRKALRHEIVLSVASATPDHCPDLTQALNALSLQDRTALRLRYYRALSVNEVAQALHISTEAAQKRILRATERLRTKIVEQQRCTPLALHKHAA